MQHLLVLALAATAAAKKCHNLTIPVELTSRNANFKLAATNDEIELQNTVLKFTRPPPNNLTQELLSDVRPPQPN